jgi:hypothetical protein
MCRGGEHRPAPGVDHAVAAGRTDLVVEEQLDVPRSGGEDGAVGRLRTDEPCMRSRPRGKCERKEQRRDERAPEPEPKSP